MGHPLIDKIVDEGLSSIDVSMLSADLRNALLSEAGTRLMHGNRIGEAAEAFAMAGNHEQLKEQGEWFLQQRRYGVAALFLRHVAGEEMLDGLAVKCLENGEIGPARKIYESLGDSQMVAFLERNFKE